MTALRSLSILLLSVCGVAGAATYTVTNTLNSGAGSLRAAINSANGNPGADTIAFAPGLAGSSILPTSALPTLFDPQTTIDGDINDDLAPDIRLDGVQQPTGAGLTLNTNNCVIEGLSVTRFPYVGIQLVSSYNCWVRLCHLGLNLTGNTSAPSATAQVLLDHSNANYIGASGKPNYVGAGTTGLGGPYGVAVRDSRSNEIQHSFFGLRRDGAGVIGNGGVGIQLYSSGEPTSGGLIRSNVLGGLYTGIHLYGADGVRIHDNRIGVTPDGLSSLPIAGDCIRLDGGSSENSVGGPDPLERNVLAGNAANGIEIAGAGTDANIIQGNLVGTNLTGNAALPIQTGIVIHPGAGAQTIGGGQPLEGNRFVPNSSSGPTMGLYLNGGGGGSLIRNNTFGRFLNGSNGPLHGHGLQISSSRAYVFDNTFARGIIAILIGLVSTGGPTHIYRNWFENCTTAVKLQGTGQAVLGNLGNPSATDDGGNRFRTNTWHIVNETALLVRAEGNGYATTSAANIQAKIHDKLDDPALGLVDFSPLIGGVAPTGGTVAVTGLAATPAARGAEVVFGLSAPGEVTVTVLNIAGRPIATLLQDRPAAAGLQRLSWSGLSDRGTAAPSGAYLVRVTVRSDAGAAAHAVAPLSLHR